MLKPIIKALVAGCGLLLLVCLHSPAMAEFNYKGTIRQYLISDPQYLNPSSSNWRRDYWVYSSAFDPMYPIVGWGGALVRMETFWGKKGSPFYLELPLSFRTDTINRGTSPLCISSSYFLLQAESELFSLMMSRQELSTDKRSSFVSLGDPLGALKLPNTGAPMLTARLTTDWQGWDLTSYYLVDYRCNFVPATEEIPEQVFEELGLVRSEMPFFDEVPTYKAFRGTKFVGPWELGLLYGQKEAVNINPRDSESGIGSSYPTNRVGYNKENIGFDLSRPISRYGQLTAAAVRSQGDWFKYGTPQQPGIKNLGKVSGDAVKLSLGDVRLGSWQMDTSYIMVEPGFQWILVRDSRYAYVYGYTDPARYNESWRTVRDEDFLLRNPNRKERYLSDVSTYLSLKKFDTQLEYPGNLMVGDKSFPVNFKVGFQDIANLKYGNIYSDPITNEEIIKDHRKVDTTLEVGKDNSNIKINGQQISYKADKDYYQELALAFNKEVEQNIFCTGKVATAQRMRNDGLATEGGASLGNIQLSGRTKSTALVSTSFDYRTGNYDWGLTEQTKDSLLPAPYQYAALNFYYNKSSNVTVKSLPLKVLFATEYIIRKSTLEGISGSSTVVYLQGGGELLPGLSATISLLDVVGPDKTAHIERFPSASINKLVDCSLSYQILGLKESTINFRFTRRFLAEDIKDNVYARFITRVGSNTWSLSMGYQPIGGPTTYRVETRYDVRLDNPEKELINRPWQRWGNRSILSDETWPYIVFSCSIPF